MSVYLHMVPETEVDYSRRGPGAYDRLASGKLPNQFRGLPVFTSYPLDTDFNGAPISLLERDRMVSLGLGLASFFFALYGAHLTQLSPYPYTFRSASGSCCRRTRAQFTSFPPTRIAL